MQLAVTRGVIALARLGTAAHAQTRHQKQVMTEQQQKLDMTVAGPQAVNGDRGTGIAAKFDWQSFLAADALEKSVPGTEWPAAWCAHPLDAIARMSGLFHMLQQRLVQARPHPGLLPIAQSSPATHPRTASYPGGQILP